MFVFRALRVLALLLAASLAHAVGVAPKSQPVPGHYIVVLKPDVASPDHEAVAIAKAHAGRVRHVYRSALKGFSVELPDAAVAALRGHPNVESVEQVMTVSLTDVQTPVIWNLDRIDQRDLPFDNSYRYNGTGAGVYAFVIDTGINPNHVEFSGRVVSGFSVIGDGLGTQDCHGHGTHVAGTLGGTAWGVAKQVTIVPVRVFFCSGSAWNDAVIAGIDWVAGSTQLRPAVANMSFASSYSGAMNAAAAGAVASGVTVVAGAGNDNADACAVSPASERSAITVAATDLDDSRAWFSNYGRCVDIFAPGVSIYSAWYASDTASIVSDGTSMAAPHVAGAAALVLESAPRTTPAKVAARLASLATTDHVSSPGTGSPNLLLFAVTGSPALEKVAVQAISGGAAIAPRGWTATATVSVRSVSTSAPVSGVLVSGRFGPGGNGTCTTDVAGSCSIGASLSSGQKATQFTVSDLAGTDIAYDSGSNVVTQIVIVRP